MEFPQNDSESYAEEERVFDFGEEDVLTPFGAFEEYGGEDFSSYLHDDDDSYLHPNHTHSTPYIPRHLENYSNNQQIQENNQENFYDTIGDQKAENSNMVYEHSQYAQINSCYNIENEDTNYYDDMPPIMKNQKKQFEKNNNFTRKLKKKIEKATMKFSKPSNHASINSTKQSMHNYTFADSKMGLELAEQTDSGIGLENGEDSMPAFKKHSWRNSRDLINQESSSLSESNIKGRYSSRDVGQKNSKGSTSLNSTVRSFFKKVSGTVKTNNTKHSY